MSKVRIYDLNTGKHRSVFTEISGVFLVAIPVRTVFEGDEAYKLDEALFHLDAEALIEWMSGWGNRRWGALQGIYRGPGARSRAQKHVKQLLAELNSQPYPRRPRPFPRAPENP